jgi:hypothetical protein
MSKKIATMALAAVLSVATAIPAAQADRGRRGDHHGYNGSHHAYNYGNRHRGRGHYVDGKWIALGVLGAFAAQALDNDQDCYRRRGRVYCR